MKNVILYVRVSTDEQASKGYSLRDQEQKLVNYCKLNNLQLKLYINALQITNINK
jgi:DNA invertase Pin-like site-specific DNA recombinase